MFFRRAPSRPASHDPRSLDARRILSEVDTDAWRLKCDGAE